MKVPDQLTRKHPLGNTWKHRRHNIKCSRLYIM